MTKKLIAGLSLTLMLAMGLVAHAQDDDEQQAEPEEQQEQAEAEPATESEQENDQQEAQTQASDQSEPDPTPSRAEQRRQRQREANQEPSLGEFSRIIDQESRMLRLEVDGKEDQSTAQVIVGTDFTTNVIFDNQSSSPADGIRILLSYSPNVIEPISINDSPIADHLDGEPVAEVDTQYGIILYEAKLSEEVIINDEPILQVRWRATKVASSTPIEFSSRQDIFTTVTYQDVDLLGNRRVTDDGTLNLNLQILPEDPREAEAMLTDPNLFLRPDEKFGGVQLYLRRQEEPVYAGEPFYIDIILDNRAFSMLDGLNVVLTFDPEVITILDVDRDNLITRETNIHDGIFRDIWSWNMHIDNSVYQARGIISYRVGTTDGEMTRGKYGPVARIWAVARRSTTRTPFLFQFDEKPRSRSTRVTYVGERVLGDPMVFNDGARGLVMGVNPARERGE